MPNEILSAQEILSFRDNAFENYHSNPKFLERIKSRYGIDAVDTIAQMTKIKLVRKILEM
jgi:hypothetical protein